MEEKLSMGKTFNSHFGFVELPSDIFQVGIFEYHLEFECRDGVYNVYPGCDPSEKLIIEKIKDHPIYE